MAQRFYTHEELLARRLLGFLSAIVGLLVFAGVVFYAASFPPSRPVAPLPDTPGATRAEDSTHAPTEAFVDRIARVRLGGRPLPERMADARRLRDLAPTPALVKEVDTLLGELTQEAHHEKRADFEKLRRENAERIISGRAAEAFAALDAFGARFSGFDDEVAQEKLRLDTLRRELLDETRRAAIAAADGGDVETVRTLAHTARLLATGEEARDIETWVARAEGRRRGLEATHPAVPGDAEPAVPPPAAASGDAAPAPPAASGTAFRGFLTADGAGMFTPQDGSEALSLDVTSAAVLADEVLSDAERATLLPRGAGLWILGEATRTRARRRDFGLVVERRISQPDFACLAAHILPDPSWQDPRAARRTWLYSTVEIAFPVLRLVIEEEAFLVDDRALPVIRRGMLTALPPLAPGHAVWAEGTLRERTLAVARLVVLAPALAGNPAYRALLGE